MRFLLIPALLTACAASGLAQTAHRVYATDHTPNRASVSDPATNEILRSIHIGNDLLGDKVPAALSQLFHSQYVVHGPGYSSAQAPFDPPDMPISSHDRIYASDQFSNTVYMVDPSSNTTLGANRQGNPSSNNFSPRR